MDWLRAAAVLALLLVATVAGGSAVRLFVGLRDLPAAAVIGLVGLLVLGAVVIGARDPQWRQNPYW